ncbi:hypothetical protein EJM73_08695 [Clostridium botulinum]|uniref:hypothetical protein n=1 Tax=Clostridium botulinum TaxID=1491 RepID=UPI00137638B5|nr:hypothetical protein [Clostridium botulinum]NCI19701.1 hypothetical protein [Clostridium botulinum]NCI35739.1 hypothetical protein [Clostridium botulinum]NCI71596.1 hypothetical protein [Clostridium botulinum]NDI38788.1 hypothetical protein [Clostridium botulinum]
MLDLEDLKLVQKKGKKAFKLDYEKKNKKLLKQIEKDFIKSLERNDKYFELDINNYEDFEKTEENLTNLQRYLEAKGFTTYCPNNDLINVHLNK